MTERVRPGPDGRPRCPWALTGADPRYLAYHDEEWGAPVRGDDALFERITLEAFQAGLSWRVILHRRDAFRRAFDGFAIAAVAAYGEPEVARLLADPGIIRNRAKVLAAVANARAAAALGPGGLDRLVWSFAPPPGRPAPERLVDVPATTAESKALAAALRTAGFRFVGPTTAYALMQACGLVDDHLAACIVRPPSAPAR